MVAFLGPQQPLTETQWMISCENPKLPATAKDPAVQFWTRQGGDAKSGATDYWLNVATRTPQKEAPVLGKGGIMADGMGLGKLIRVPAKEKAS
jgi:SWI/SNF-related matrix-associated actin-dependent regulator of chromatin subfamily A3